MLIWYFTHSARALWLTDTIFTSSLTWRNYTKLEQSVRLREEETIYLMILIISLFWENNSDVYKYFCVRKIFGNLWCVYWRSVKILLSQNILTVFSVIFIIAHIIQIPVVIVLGCTMWNIVAIFLSYYLYIWYSSFVFSAYFIPETLEDVMIILPCINHPKSLTSHFPNSFVNIKCILPKDSK